MNHDVLIFSGMVSAIGLGLWGACTNAGIYYRIASLAAALPMCVGLAYFGWRPYFAALKTPEPTSAVRCSRLAC